MNLASPNSPETLCRAILAEASRECDDIRARAEREAQTILARAKADARENRDERLLHARTEADRRRELLLATVPVETERLRAARVESFLQSIRDEVRQRLAGRAGFDYREALSALAAEPLGRMTGEAFVIKLAPADHAAFGSALAAAVRERVGRPSLTIALVADPSIAEVNGGVIVEDAEGRQVWDNSLVARLERLWPQARLQLAVHTGLVTTVSPPGGAA